MKLHRFNSEGINRFGQYLDALSINPGLGIPTDLLSDTDYAVLVPPGSDVAMQQFRNRMEVAKYLDSILSKIENYDPANDAGLWVWLTLFYFDQLCPKDSGGNRYPKNRARYIPEIEDYKKYYRHLLAGPYRVFRAHRTNPDRALVLLCGPLDRPGEIAEQMMSRQQIITNPGVIELATNLYYNQESGSFKRGAASKGGGSSRRFAIVLNQLDLTWDLYSMTAIEILGKMPNEFYRFAKQNR